MGSKEKLVYLSVTLWMLHFPHMISNSCED